MHYHHSDDLKLMGELKQLASPGFSAFVESASLEALGRILGYTEKQLDLAGDTLSRFSWHSPPEHGQRAQRTGAESRDSDSGRNWAA